MKLALDMNKSLFKNALVVLCASLLVPAAGMAEGVVEAEADTFFDLTSIQEKKDKTAEMWSMLQERQADHAIYAEIRANLDEEGKKLLIQDREQTPNQKFRVGLQVPVGEAVDFGPRAFLSKNSGLVGVTRIDRDALTWTTSIESAGASAIRVKFTDFSLPDGAELYLYNDEGQAFGPFTGIGPHGDGEFWSNAVFGDHVWIQVHGTAPERGAGFIIDAVSHLGPGFEIADTAGRYLKSDCSGNVSCVENAECYGMDTILGSARKGVAKMIYEENGGSYLCSGGLLNDSDSSDRKAWFLTANHCFDSEASANSLETYFQYQSNCGSCSASYVDSVLGSDLWATGTASDFTLVQLSELPSSWTLQGWSNATVQVDTLLYRISHPKGKRQAYSQREAKSTVSGNYILTRNLVGTTEGGSSGSPIFRSDRKVVGQLRGITYSGSYDLCDASTFTTKDGALSAYWKSVKAYLSNQSAKMHVDAVSAGTATLNMIFSKLYHGRASVTVVDELGNPVPNVTVTGTFSNGLSGTYSGVTNDSGVAKILHPALNGSKPSYTFCVTNLSQQFFDTYDSGANSATCASR